jgi:hypothetical protein
VNQIITGPDCQEKNRPRIRFDDISLHAAGNCSFSPLFLLTNRFEKIDIEPVSQVLKATAEFNGKTTEKESAPS